MSELEKTAPNEIYLIVGDTDKNCNFNELAEVTWAEKPIYEETAIKYVKSLQLTIPKSIADELNGYFKYKNPFEAILRDNSVRSNDVIKELRDYLDFLHSNLELCVTYLAGKALGVDLVKVGADD